MKRWPADALIQDAIALVTEGANVTEATLAPWLDDTEEHRGARIAALVGVCDVLIGVVAHLTGRSREQVLRDLTGAA